MYRVIFLISLSMVLIGCGGSSTDPDPEAGTSAAYLKTIDVK